jgi:hypothetical protein
MIQYFESDILYEDENLADQLRAQKAATIIQRTLHPNTVLFTFNSDMFKDRTEAYAVIGKEIGLAKASNPSACTAIKSATY